ncbi:MAG: hypothetical protein [Caudoviricetes sp.]|nr:MAG: hypothetical protein [Caudoviricetes sp.]
MKGYTNVYMHDAKTALAVWEAGREQALIIRDGAIDLMYRNEYENGSMFTKWWHRKSSKIGFCRSKMTGFFCLWSEVLHEYITSEEADILDNWQWKRGQAEYAAVKALVNGGYGELMMGDELCRWINKQLGR